MDSIQSCRSLPVLRVIEIREMKVEAVVKGYHECPFAVRMGEAFSLEKKKIGSLGEAFRVVKCEMANFSEKKRKKKREKTGTGAYHHGVELAASIAPQTMAI